MQRKRLITGLAVGLCSLTTAAAATAAPSATLRIEGEQQTLLPRTAVTLLDSPEPHTNCPGDSVAAAIEVGTNGNWDRQQFVQTILGETHDFSRNDYWSIWVWRGGRFVRGNGICDEHVAQGEDVLAHVDFYDANFEPTVLPLALLDVPATVKPDQPFTVRVFEYQCENQYCPPGDGRPAPRPGATVTAEGDTDVTDAEGRVTLTLADRGPATLRATAPNRVPTAIESTCVTSGDDGRCGTTTATGTAPVTTVAGPDLRAPQGRILGIAEQQRFRRGRGPRELHGTVEADPSGLAYVKLRLTRRHRGLCQYFSGRQERFRRTRCGSGAVFAIEPTATWSYLLPRSLPRGRYVLDVVAADRAGNRDALARGRNRVVFSVG